jgi:hypothetical protein
MKLNAFFFSFFQKEKWLYIYIYIKEEEKKLIVNKINWWYQDM